MLKTLLLAAFAASTIVLTLIPPRWFESRRLAHLYRAQEKWAEEQDRQAGRDTTTRRRVA